MSVDPPLNADAVTDVANLSQEETNARVAGATGILVLGNIGSRVLGLARETVLTYLFGASGAVDAFQVAIVVPKALFDLLIAGHVNSAIVPVLSEVVTKGGRQELWRVVSILFSIVTALLAGLILVLELFAPQIVALVAGGASAATQSLAVDLLRLTSPALMFMGLFAMFSGTLYALHSFVWPAFAGVVFNGSIVAVALLFTPPPTFILTPPNGGIPSPLLQRPAEGVAVVALGWLVGALGQMLLQLPGLRGAKIRFTLRWRHPAVRQMVVLYAPVMFSLIMDTLIIRPFSYNLASGTGEGSIAYMNWATTLIQFPQGLVATAISLAILPTLSQQAAALAMIGERAFKDTLGLGLRLTTVLILPSAVGLFVLATPIIDLIFEHGAFTAADTAITGMALRLYLIGLPFAAIDLLLIYAFYARQDTLTPALVGLLSLSVYMVVALVLLPQFGLFSLMIADSLKHVTHASVSAYLLWRRLGGLGAQDLLFTVVKTAAAAGLMAIAAGLALPYLARFIGTDGLLSEALLVVAAGGLSALVYIGMAWLLHIGELRWMIGLVRRKLGG